MRLKGSRELLRKDIIRACQLADDLEKQGCRYAITLFPRDMEEFQRCVDAWPGFKITTTGLAYKGVVIWSYCGGKFDG